MLSKYKNLQENINEYITNKYENFKYTDNIINISEINYKDFLILLLQFASQIENFSYLYFFNIIDIKVIKLTKCKIFEIILGKYNIELGEGKYLYILTDKLFYFEFEYKNIEDYDLDVAHIGENYILNNILVKLIEIFESNEDDNITEFLYIMDEHGPKNMKNNLIFNIIGAYFSNYNKLDNIGNCGIFRISSNELELMKNNIDNILDNELRDIIEGIFKFEYDIDVIYPYNLSLLGGGSYGDVYMSNNEVIKHFLRELDLYSSTPKIIVNKLLPYSFLNEMSILKFIDNKCDQIVYVIDYNSSILSMTITMEYGGISLSSYLKSIDGKLPENVLIDIVYQILLGLNFMELNGIIHQDIKFENILIDSNMKIKIIDFGLSCITNYNCISPYIQTYYTRSPEITLGYDISRKPTYNVRNIKMDVWSVAMMVYSYISDDNNTYDIGDTKELRILYYSIITNSTNSVDKISFKSDNIKYVNDDINKIKFVINNETISMVDIIEKYDKDNISDGKFKDILNIESTINKFLGMDAITYDISPEYFNLWSFIHNYMLVFQEKDRLYPSELITFDIFNDVRNNHDNNVIKLNNRTYNISSETLNEIIDKPVIKIIQNLLLEHRHIHFDTIRLSFILLDKISKNTYVLENKSVIYFVCIAISDIFFRGEDKIYESFNLFVDNYGEDLKIHLIQSKICESVDNNFIFHDQRNKNQYLYDLNNSYLNSIRNKII